METGAKRKLNRSPKASPPREWSNMERSSCERKDVDTMSLACVSRLKFRLLIMAMIS